MIRGEWRKNGSKNHGSGKYCQCSWKSYHKLIRITSCLLLVPNNFRRLTTSGLTVIVISFGPGTKGSLPSYLHGKKFPHDEVRWLTLSLLALRFIPTKDEFKHAVSLLREHCNKFDFAFIKQEEVREHVFSYYFSCDPIRFGPAHCAGSPQSTNGLEKTLGNLKKGSVMVHQQLLYPDKLHSLLFEVQSFSAKSFSQIPSDLKVDWDRICLLAQQDQLPNTFQFGGFLNRESAQTPEIMPHRQKMIFNGFHYV